MDPHVDLRHEKVPDANAVTPFEIANTLNELSTLPRLTAHHLPLHAARRTAEPSTRAPEHPSNDRRPVTGDR